MAEDRINKVEERGMVLTIEFHESFGRRGQAC
jgi:hypothetical protein